MVTHPGGVSYFRRWSTGSLALEDSEHDWSVFLPFVKGYIARENLGDIEWTPNWRA